MNKELSKEIAAAVLDHCYGYGAVNDDMIERTSVVVKRVLDKQAAPVEPVKQEPVTEGCMKCPACKDRGVIRQHFTELERMLIEDAFEKAVKNATLPKPVQQAEQEPVAIVDANDDGYWADILPDRSVKVGQKLYAAPVRTKDLTDEQQQLARFYQVETLSELVAAMEKHINRLQEKLPPAANLFQRTPREG